MLLRGGIQAHDRLVEHEQAVRADQRARELDLLSHSSRELAWPRVTLVLEAEATEQPLDPIVEIIAGGAVGDGDELEVLAHGQVRIQRRRVGDDRHRRPGLDPGGLLVDRRAGHLDDAGSRLEQAGDRPDRGRLARAVVTDDRHALASVNHELEIRAAPRTRRSSD